MVEYAELHAHSAFSFLDGVSLPERLVTEAVRLGLSGLALTDHDGFHGAAVVGPDDGEMACGEFGPGRMAEPAAILQAEDQRFYEHGGVDWSAAARAAGAGAGSPPSPPALPWCQ